MPGQLPELTRDTIALASIAVQKNQIPGRGIGALIAAALIARFCCCWWAMRRCG
jgi:hypothetical protein